ncbi:MAG: hypothetical protein ACOCZJ_03110 [Thermoplasmatota archaeon]
MESCRNSGSHACYELRVTAPVNHHTRVIKDPSSRQDMILSIRFNWSVNPVGDHST